MPVMETMGLVREIDVFLAESDMAESTFGRKAVNDGKFVNRIRQGGDVSIRIAEKVRLYIASERLKRVENAA